MVEIAIFRLEKRDLRFEIRFLAEKSRIRPKYLFHTLKLDFDSVSEFLYKIKKEIVKSGEPDIEKFWGKKSALWLKRNGHYFKKSFFWPECRPVFL